MFNILVLRELYVGDQMEFQIADRLSFQRFLGIGVEHTVPDYTAMWRFAKRSSAEDVAFPSEDAVYDGLIYSRALAICRKDN